MGNEGKTDKKNPRGTERSASGLHVPLPAIVMGLGMLASTAPADALAVPQANSDQSSTQLACVAGGASILDHTLISNCSPFIGSVPTLEPVALVGLSGLLALYGLRRRKQD
jgi:hypothetical protein